jgi:hypothetical protein
MEDDILDELLEDAAAGGPDDLRAPSRLKSRIYSALMTREAASGALLSLPATEAAGRRLCIFESLASACPAGERVTEFNFCRVCHARVLAERMEGAPVFWKHCPYAEFQKP